MARARGKRHPKWLLTGLLSAMALAGGALLLLALYWPFTERGLIDVLQQRTVRSVTIGSFRVTYLPPGCVAEQICFLHRKHKEKPPLITSKKIVVRGCGAAIGAGALAARLD